MWSKKRFLSAATILTLGAFAPASLPAQHSNLDAAELALKNVQLAPGLEIDIFAADPQLFNPVAFTIDEQGRFFISETHRYKESIFDIWAATQDWKDADASFKTVEDRAKFLAQEYAGKIEILTKDSEIIRLVEDRDGDGRADHSEVFADGFNETVSGTAAGVLARNGQLWFTNIPDLWRFSYDENGVATEREVLHTGYGVHIGVSGHDLHGLIIGPDGKLYFSVGDRGAHVVTKEGKILDSIDTGAVFRCDLDGSNLEIFATGLRNPQELAFDHLGNLWAHDNDTGGADKSRVMHVVEDADFGWRYSYQFMSGFGPWVQEEVWKGDIDDVLPNAGYGAQGPSGLAFNPGTGLPASYDNHFIAINFPQGALTYAPEAKGASYIIVNRADFIRNSGITDVEFGPDGDVYFTDWGRTYRLPDSGRIYRVFDPEQVNSPAKAELKELLSTGMAHREIPELAELLAHRDLRVRQAAQFELAARGQKSDAPAAIAETLQNVALKNENQLARIHALWALRQISPQTAESAIAQLLADSDPELRAQAAKFAPETGSADLAPSLTGLLADESLRVRFYAARALGKLAAQNPALNTAGLVDSLFNFIRENNDADAYLVHAGMMALLNIGDFANIERAATDDSAAVRRVALLAMRRLDDPRIAQFLSDSAPRLRYEAARAINDAPVNAAMPDLAALLANPETDENILTRAINANFRLGQPENADAIAAFASRENVAEKFRVDAISALGDWENPAPRDRVMGLWRPLDSRAPDAARDALAEIAPGILANAPESVLVALVQSAGKLHATAIANLLFETLQKPETSVALRQAIPATLVKIGFNRLPEMMQVVLSDSDLAIRRSGIELLDQVKVENASALLADLLATETDIRLSQAAISTLGRLREPAAGDVIAGLLDQMLAGKIRPELHLEILEAAGKSPSVAVKQRLAKFAETLKPDDPVSPYRVTLVGGDATIGKKIYDENDALGCLRCHSINGKGGNVGPDLAGIGSKKSREYLLQAIIEPNATFAEGFERVVLVLKNGDTVAGLVENETDESITLSTPENRVVQKSEIETRHPAISAMPPGLEKLISHRELRDLMEYLTTL